MMEPTAKEGAGASPFFPCACFTGQRRRARSLAPARAGPDGSGGGPRSSVIRWPGFTPGPCLRQRHLALGGLSAFVHGAVLAMARGAGAQGRRQRAFLGGVLGAAGAGRRAVGRPRGPLGICQGLAWHLTAIYWTLAATGMQAAGRANAMVLLDGVAGLFTLPFGNFLLRLQLLWRGLKGAYRRRAAGWGPDRRRRRWELAAGLVLALLLGGYALGELSAADAGFGALMDRWLRWPRLDDRTLVRLFEQLFTWPCRCRWGAWLFGLAGAGLRRKAPPVPKRRSTPGWGDAPGCRGSPPGWRWAGCAWSMRSSSPCRRPSSPPRWVRRCR